MDPTQMAAEAEQLAERAHALAVQIQALGASAAAVGPVVDPFIYLLSVFLMACFVGYYVVWNVTPALHSPADVGDQRDIVGDSWSAPC